MEAAKKKTRAPKAMIKQLDFLIAYMENHTDFATGKLLGARGKSAHDDQWKHLTAQLNYLDGPSKNVEGWKKLWCDQRSQARSRAAKAKETQQRTGNIGEKIHLKDFDLRILSIFGGESSVGLPIMEIGFGERSEDINDPSLILGLTSNVSEKENIAIYNKENEIAITDKNINDEENVISFSLNEEDTFVQNVNEQTRKYNSTTGPILHQSIDEPSTSSQHLSCNISTALKTTDQSIDESPVSSKHVSSNISTALKSISKRPLADILNTIKCSKKRLKNSSIEETKDYITKTQEKQNETLQEMLGTLNRIASATEEKNELFKALLIAL